MDVAQMILDFVAKVVWPVLVLILAFTFKGPVSRALASLDIRRLKAGPSGIELEMYAVEMVSDAAGKVTAVRSEDALDAQPSEKSTSSGDTTTPAPNPACPPTGTAAPENKSQDGKSTGKRTRALPLPYPSRLESHGAARRTLSPEIKVLIEESPKEAIRESARLLTEDFIEALATVTPSLLPPDREDPGKHRTRKLNPWLINAVREANLITDDEVSAAYDLSTASDIMQHGAEMAIVGDHVAYEYARTASVLGYNARTRAKRKLLNDMAKSDRA